MIDISRIYGLDIDLDNLMETSPNINFKQYDYQTSYIAFRFFKKGNLIENIGDNYIIGVFKDKKGDLFINKDGSPIRTYAFNHEEKGVIVLPISKEVICQTGTISCEMIIINRNGKKVTSPRFNFNIYPSLLDFKEEQEQYLESVCGTFRAGEKLCGFGNARNINIEKYISYEKTVWIDGETVVNEERLNHMENGIYNATNALNNLDTDLSNYKTEIDNSISTVKDTLDKLVETSGSVYEGEEPPEDTNLIWYDTSDKSIDEKLDSLIIQELKNIISTLSVEISTLKEKVEYLWNNQGNGGSLPSNPSDGDSLLMEDGSYLLLEDGSKILLEYSISEQTIEILAEEKIDYIKEK
jgi:hypothetical protein